jgi:hypothetical protein
MKHLALLALLLAPLARADVTWTISGCDVNLDCAFTLSGDPGPVTITLTGGTLDYIGSSASAGYVTSPPIGNNGDGVGLRSTALTGPRSGRLDIDGAPAFPGGSISFAGRTATFAQSGTSWTARVTTTGPVEQVVKVAWTNATQNTDCSPLPAWNSTDPARVVETRVQYGRLAGGVFTSAGEVRVPMPGSSTEFSAVVGADFAVQAEHATAAGALSAVAGPAQVGGAPTTVAPCVPPPPPPPPVNPCELRPFTFSIRTWPGGLTGSRSLAYSSNKAIDRLELGRSSTRVNRVTATDSEGCAVTVTR